MPPLKEFAMTFCIISCLTNFEATIPVTLCTALVLSSIRDFNFFSCALICQLLVEMSVFVVRTSKDFDETVVANLVSLHSDEMTVNQSFGFTWV